MSTLYDITNEYAEILNDCCNEEDLSEELVERLENIDEAFNEKVHHIALVIGELKADCVTIDKEIERLNGRLTTRLRNLRRLEAYLRDKMVYIGKSKMQTPLHTISIRKSKKTEVSREFIEWAIENLKEDCLNKKVTYTPNKTLIKKEIENDNLEYPYAKLIENQNLIIK